MRPPWAGLDPMVIDSVWQMPGQPDVFLARVLRDGKWTTQTIDREIAERLQADLAEAIAHLSELVAAVPGTV